MPQISPNAMVEKSAELADDVRVGPFAYIGPAVRIGPGCVIDTGASILGRTTLGAKCHVFPFTVIGADAGQTGNGECFIGQANSFREHVTICAGLKAPTRIGDDNLIMIGCQIGPAAVIGDHCILTNSTQIEGRSQIDDYVGTSAFTYVSAGVRVGSYTYIAGYTGVEDHAPPFAMVQGCPARVMWPRRLSSSAVSATTTSAPSRRPSATFSTVPPTPPIHKSCGGWKPTPR